MAASSVPNMKAGSYALVSDQYWNDQMDDLLEELVEANAFDFNAVSEKMQVHAV
jgi:hypothetical protein